MSAVRTSASTTAIQLLSSVGALATAAATTFESAGCAANVLHNRAREWESNSIRASAIRAETSDEVLVQDASLAAIQRQKQVDDFIGDDEAVRDRYNTLCAKYATILANLK